MFYTVHLLYFLGAKAPLEIAMLSKSVNKSVSKKSGNNS